MLGSRLVELLADEGWTVRALVRPGSDSAALEAAGAELRPGDVTDPETVRRAVEGCRAVFHAAALVPGSGASEEEFHRVNAEGTRNVLAAALGAGVARAVHVSTVNTLGGEPGTVTDESAGPPVQPHRGYDASKIAAEEVAREHAAAGLNVVIVSPSVMFGPRSRYSGRLIEMFLRGRLPVVPIPGRRMSFVFVDDAARGCLLAMERGSLGERYILSAAPVRLGDFISDLAAVSGRRGPRLSLPAWLVAVGVGVLWTASPLTRWRPPVTVTGIRRGGVLYDGAKAERELGLEYTALRDALAATVHWLREQGRVPG
jgi:dihydroflavonol-4-reductase